MARWADVLRRPSRSEDHLRSRLGVPPRARRSVEAGTPARAAGARGQNLPGDGSRRVGAGRAARMMTTSAASARRIRPVRIATNDVIVRHATNGVVYLRSPLELGPYPVRLTDALDEWAERAPDRIYLAQRTESG